MEENASTGWNILRWSALIRKADGGKLLHLAWQSASTKVTTWTLISWSLLSIMPTGIVWPLWPLISKSSTGCLAVSLRPGIKVSDFGKLMSALCWLSRHLTLSATIGRRKWMGGLRKIVARLHLGARCLRLLQTDSVNYYHGVGN